MNRRRTYLWLAAASGYTGFGVIVGYLLSNHTSNAALWLGIVLLFLYAVLLGMYISARGDARRGNLQENRGPQASSSGNITDLPPKH
ncbi:MAG TPA: hypothetical protein VFH39_00695 [Candidatus Saccharimonadales bacterium]|nr:hypothetical protein [Candidatus Saccharimonadales bacterium]